MRTLIRTCTQLLAIGILVACTSTPQITPDYTGIEHLQSAKVVEQNYPDISDTLITEDSTQQSEYRIGPQDELIINVWGRSDLGSQISSSATDRIRTTKVHNNGEISLPVVGSILVLEKTIEQARKEIKDRHFELMELLHIDVQLHSCNSQAVYTAGAVNNPGVQYLCGNMTTLGDVLTASGGLTVDAFESGGVLKREGKLYNLGYPLSEELNSYHNIVLRAGDLIFFPRITEGKQPVVHIYGEVVDQGTYVIPPQGISLLGALGLASGLDNITAEVDTIYISRIELATNNTITYQATMAEVLENPDIQLVNGDRIFVAPRGITRWNRWWRQAIPSIVPRPRVD